MSGITAVAINWTGKQLSSDEQFVLHDAALRFKGHSSDKRLMFEHPLCDGVIQSLGRMAFGEYRGYRYLATLDAIDGTSRTYEFLLTDYYVESGHAPAKYIWHMRLEDGTSTKIDSDVAKKTRVTSVARSRAN